MYKFISLLLPFKNDAQRPLALACIFLFVAGNTYAEHQYCVVPDLSKAEDTICMSGNTYLHSTLKKYFGGPASLFASMSLPNFTDADKMVFIQPKAAAKTTNSALSIRVSPLDDRWKNAVNECAKGDQLACATQGTLMIQKGYTAPRNIYVAKKLLEQSCKAGVGEGCHGLGTMRFTGLAMEKDVGLGISVFKRACALGYSESCVELGMGYSHGYRGIRVDFKESFIYYKTACDMGNLPGCTELGYSYAHGEGVEQNYDKVAELWSNACSKKHSHACYSYAELIRQSAAIPNKDEVAVGYFKQACDLGHKQSCDILSALLEEL